LAFSVITDVLIVLASALLVGELFEQFCLPSVVGELLSGMIIGSSLLGLVVITEPASAISSLALFFIVFHIGFEMKTHMVRGKLVGASLLSVTSFVLPLLFAIFASFLLFPFGAQENLIIALAIAIPSISIISVLVLQYHLLESMTGQIILSSVTISDILSFIILAGIVRPLQNTLIIVLEIIAFVVIFVGLDWVLNRRPEDFQRLLNRGSRILRREDFSYALLIIIGLAISVVFQNIGLSYILGAFFAGLIVHDGLIGRKPFDRISQTLSTMNRIFFIPVFFGLAGVEVMLQNINYSLYLELGLLITIVLAVGVLTTYYVSKVVLRRKIDVVPKQTAGILSGRGAIGIVIATVALNEGSISNVGFSLVILATLVMSLTIPFLAGKMCKGAKNSSTSSK
jgi:Kef-type K+ transport system membrane component KefB